MLHWFIFTIVFMLCTTLLPVLAYECPKPTQQLAQDVSTQLHSEITQLKGLNSTQFDASAKIITRDVFEKYPDAGTIALAHTMLSMFCQIILPSKMEDAAKLDQLYKMAHSIRSVSGYSVPMHKSTGTTCSTARADVLRPINAVFDAWQRLDVNLYLAQWGPESIQRSKFYVRRMEDIVDRRRADFAKYQSVTVVSTAPKIVFADGTTAEVENTYTMHFVRTNGTKFSETGKKERYVLECSAADKGWRIRENNDYL